MLSARVSYDPTCDAGTGVTTSEATLSWRVTGATGITVAIDDANEADGTPYSGTSGAQDLTLIHCDSSYTFDVWTTGGSSGRTAHQRFAFHGS